MSASSVAAVVAVVCLLIVGWYALVDGDRLQPTRREVLVKEVDNGYLVLYRTTNNPYPVKEAVAKTRVEAAEQVHEYLRLPLPATEWGK